MERPQQPLVVGQRATFPIVIENHGASETGPVDLQVMVGSGLRNPTVKGAYGQQWDCIQASGTMTSTWQTFTCTTDGVEANSHKVFFVNADVADFTDSWLYTLADPFHRVSESNEQNNFGK